MPSPKTAKRCDNTGPSKDRSLSLSSTSTTVNLLFILMISTLSVVSWNVHGLTRELKREHLVSDAIRYGFDIIALQETKCQFYDELQLMNYSLILFEQLPQGFYHHGQGFLISPQLSKCIIDTRRISNRVSFINFRLTSKNGTLTHFRIINAYGPTMENVKDGVDVSSDTNVVLDEFYADLNSALDIPAHYDVFIAGDFNSRLGSRSDGDVQAGLSRNMGNYGVGQRNSNGQCLLNFMVEKDLFACNTSFKHPSRHITSWHGTTTSRDDPDETVKYYKQIDYILCKSNYKVNVTDARSYGGALLDSDHKPVVARVQLHRKYLVHKKHKTPRKLNVKRLQDRGVKLNMLNTFEKKMKERRKTGNPNDDLNSLITDAYSTAEEVLGTIPPNKHKSFSTDPEIYNLSLERKKLIVANMQNKHPTNRKLVKTNINQLKRQIKKRLRAINNCSSDLLINEINTTNDFGRYYGASKILAKGYVRPALTIHNSAGNNAGTDEEKARIIKEYFKAELNDSDEPLLSAFLDPPSSLDCPITVEEVEKAISKLKSGKAVGIDKVPGEVMKALNYPLLHNELVRVFNESFEKNIHIEAIGAGILTPLAKPGKPRGPVKSIRPLTLLNISRKILSLIVLNRIELTVDNFTGPFQAAYKAGRSCADLVWAQNMLISVVMKKKFEWSKVSIDMSAAFNTIRRRTTINLLEAAGCSRDDQRLVQYLMANTTLVVRVKSTDSDVFDYNIGASQGESAAGKLFTLNLAGGLMHIRAVLPSRPNPPIAMNGMPLESGYSDDIEKLGENMEELKYIFHTSKKILKEWSLFVNDSKTQFTRVYLEEVGVRDEWGNELRGEEAWRNEMLLGTKLGSEVDVAHRINKANTAFWSFDKLWCQGPKRSQITEERKIRLYDSLVVSVLLYNCCCWAVTQTVLESINVVHRKHLRRILNIYWPNTISNKALYARTQTKPLSERVEKARWTMLGHVLRSDNCTPAYQAFLFAALGCEDLKGRAGRHRTNLFDIIVKKDLYKRNIYLKSEDDFTNLVIKAQDRLGWKSLFTLRHIGRRSLRKRN